MIIQHGYWNTNGRIGREVFLLRYFLPFLLSTMFLCAILVSASIIAGRANESAGLSDEYERYFVLGSNFFFVIAGIPLVATFAAYLIGKVKRLHDTGNSGTWIVLTFFPPLNLALFLYLAIIKGHEETTEYGHNPVPIRRAGKRKTKNEIRR